MHEYLDYPLQPGPLVVEHVQVMHGANYFSAGPVVVFRLNLGVYDEVFSNAIPGFYEKFTQWMPSMIEHHCSVGVRGGFFQRIQDGTLLGHIMEHTAIELQHLAGMEVSYGKTRSTLKQGVYNVVFRYFDEEAGIYAGKAAFNLLNALLQDRSFDVEAVVRNLVLIREKNLLGPSTQAIVEEAKARGIPTLRMDNYNFVQLGTGKYLKRIRATITSDTGAIAVETAEDKYLCLQMLRDAGMPVPEGRMSDKFMDVLNFWKQLQAPIVLKPRHGHRGLGVGVGLNTPEDIERVFRWAIQFDDQVLAQACLPGQTYRLLIIDSKLAAASRLQPPCLVGDGRRTLAQLWEELNSDPRRGYGDKSLLTRVELDDITQFLMESRDINLATILPEGLRFDLKISGTLALGGSSEDVTDRVHPINRFLAERAVQVMGLDVAAVELVCPDIAVSILENGGACTEIHAAPDFRTHLHPTEGQPRNVAQAFLTKLFPENQKTRIPVFSVTGTAGKTTTVMLLAHCLGLAGHIPGVTSTDGLFVAGRKLMEGDKTYPEHVGLVLKDPTIDCAVLETSREGILRRGLGYELADFGIVLNMHGDHVGTDDIQYVEDLAYAKSVVAEQVYKKGYAILNADQEMVLEMQDRVDSRLALFSRNYRNEAIREHVAQGGLAVVLDGKDFRILDGRERFHVLRVEEIPITFEGKARLNDDAILASIAALYAHGLTVETIRQGLTSFFPGPGMLPGRMNLLKVRGMDVLVDYAHNRIAFEMLKDFLTHTSQEKWGLLDAPGDRPDEVIRELGALAAQTYQKLYLYEDPDRRGREVGEILKLLQEGALAVGFPADSLHTFSSLESALEAALAQTSPEHLLVVLGDQIPLVLGRFMAITE